MGIEKPLWVWVLFASIILLLLVIDLGFFNKKEEVISFKKSLYLSIGYIFIALIFGAWVYQYLGAQAGLDYFTAYAVEKSLSMDNVFVISLIFSHFAIPVSKQHRLLFLGVLGALVLRAIMIGLGVAIVSKFSFILFVFGVFLIITGIKIIFSKEDKKNFGENKLVIFLKSKFNLSNWWLALICIELADLVFAIDSVPAVLAITQDPYIVYTSNIFAILGLRSLYFCLASMVERFYYLKYSLACILIYVGAKIFIAPLLGHIPSGFSLAIIFICLAGGILASFLKLPTNRKIS
jgi:tellurite resistance protein TerC